MMFRKLARAALLVAGLTSVASVEAGAAGRQLIAVLNGGNECNAGGTCKQGDLDGSGLAVIWLHSTTQMCFSIHVSAINNPTAAHIHTGTEGNNGGVFISLTAPATGNPGSSSGCITITSAQNTALRANPQNFYVNVHNGTFPSGAMRGQLF